jgi:hypothetical protein
MQNRLSKLIVDLDINSMYHYSMSSLILLNRFEYNFRTRSEMGFFKVGDESV